MKRHSIALALAAALAIAGGAQATARPEGINKVNGGIIASAGQTYGDLETVNGGIQIEAGVHAGNAATVNGSIKVAERAQTGDLGTVNGGIRLDREVQVDGGMETVNGDITVGVGSHVHGGIKIEKPTSNWLPISMGKRRPPRIIIGPNAVVDGPLVFERDVRLYVHKTAKIGSVSGATAVPYDGERAPEE